MQQLRSEHLEYKRQAPSSPTEIHTHKERKHKHTQTKFLCHTPHIFVFVHLPNPPLSASSLKRTGLPRLARLNQGCLLRTDEASNTRFSFFSSLSPPLEAAVFLGLPLAPCRPPAPHNSASSHTIICSLPHFQSLLLPVRPIFFFLRPSSGTTADLTQSLLKRPHPPPPHSPAAVAPPSGPA